AHGAVGIRATRELAVDVEWEGGPGGIAGSRVERDRARERVRGSAHGGGAGAVRDLGGGARRDAGGRAGQFLRAGWGFDPEHPGGVARVAERVADRACGPVPVPDDRGAGGCGGTARDVFGGAGSGSGGRGADADPALVLLGGAGGVEPLQPVGVARGFSGDGSRGSGARGAGADAASRRAAAALRAAGGAGVASADRGGGGSFGSELASGSERAARGAAAECARGLLRAIAGEPGPRAGSFDARGVVRPGGRIESCAVGDPSPCGGRRVVARALGGPGERSSAARCGRGADRASGEDDVVPGVVGATDAARSDARRGAGAFLLARGVRGRDEPLARGPCAGRERGEHVASRGAWSRRGGDAATAAGSPPGVPDAPRGGAADGPGAGAGIVCIERERGAGRGGSRSRGAGGWRGGSVAHGGLVHDAVPGALACFGGARRGIEGGEGGAAERAGSVPGLRAVAPGARGERSCDVERGELQLPGPARWSGAFGEWMECGG